MRKWWSCKYQAWSTSVTSSNFRLLLGDGHHGHHGHQSHVPRDLYIYIMYTYIYIVIWWFNLKIACTSKSSTYSSMDCPLQTHHFLKIHWLRNPRSYGMWSWLCFVPFATNPTWLALGNPWNGGFNRKITQKCLEILFFPAPRLITGWCFVVFFGGRKSSISTVIYLYTYLYIYIIYI